jgi:hypothetical protein
VASLTKQRLENEISLPAIKSRWEKPNGYILHSKKYKMKWTECPTFIKPEATKSNSTGVASFSFNQNL